MSDRALRSARETTDRISAQLAALAGLADDRELLELRAPSVSAWSVGEQLEHLRRSDLTILAALDQLDSSSEMRGGPSLIGRLVLATGYIPRGRGRAPKATEPLEVDPEALGPGLEDVRQSFERLRPRLPELASSPARIKHPALGLFSAAQMLAFTAIHHRHHEKIITDIRRAAAPSDR